MGKKKGNPKKNKNKNNNNNKELINIDPNLPFVSVCTPTFNRRPFIPYMIKCFEHQDYPKSNIEWIIIDDGTDNIEDLVINIPQVKYFKYNKKMPLGKKRNIMHEKSCGDIIVYMDDDDYYPPQRISHAVSMLSNNKKALCAGSSEIYIWFKHIQKMYQFGPYNENHATAGTFAFKRELLKEHSYENHAALAEEKHFLKNYTVPFVQLEPKKVILVFSHEHNTFDKRKLLENPNPNFIKESDKTVDDFVKEPELKDFYMNQIDDLLKDYEPGKPSMKPDVLEQMVKIEEERRKMAEKIAQEQGAQGQIMIQNEDGTQKKLSNDEIVNIMKGQQENIKNLINILNEKDNNIKNLKNEIKILTKKFELYENEEHIKLVLNKNDISNNNTQDNTQDNTQNNTQDNTQNNTQDNNITKLKEQINNYN